jgi:hypothetical protein
MPFAFFGWGAEANAQTGPPPEKSLRFAPRFYRPPHKGEVRD